MPYPVFDEYFTQLNFDTAQQFNAASQSLTEWLSVDHKSDGHHGHVVADAVTIVGDLTVEGAAVFEDVVINTLTVNEIITDLLTVNTSALLNSANITDGLNIVNAQAVFDATGANPTANFSASSLALEQGTMRWIDSGLGSDQIIFKYGTVGSAEFNVEFSAASGINTFAGSVSVTDDFTINTNKFTVDGATGDTFIFRDLVIGGDLSVTDDFSVNTNKFTVDGGTGNTVIAGTLGVTGDVAVNTNKFTVTAASGNTAIAGTLNVTGTVLSGVITTTGLTVALANAGNAITLTATTAANSAYQSFSNNSGGRLFVGRDNSAGNAIGTAGRAFAGSIWQESNNDIQFGTNNTERMSITGAGVIAIVGALAVDGTTFNVDAANDRVGIGTASPSAQLHTTGGVRFASMANFVLATDGNGNLQDFGGIDHDQVVLTDLIGGSNTLHFTAGILTSVT